MVVKLTQDLNAYVAHIKGYVKRKLIKLQFYIFGDLFYINSLFAFIFIIFTYVNVFKLVPLSIISRSPFIPMSIKFSYSDKWYKSYLLISHSSHESLPNFLLILFLEKYQSPKFLLYSSLLSVLIDKNY